MRKFLKWLGIGFGCLIGMLLIAYVVIHIGSSTRLSKTYDIKVKPMAFYSDSNTIALGRQIGTAVTKCVDCHGDNLGGKLFIDAPIGHLSAPNITTGEGSVVRSFKDEDWIKAIRHGISPEGRPLWVMPAEEFQNLSFEEINAIVAWVKSVPPVNNTSLTENSLTPLGRVLFTFGQIPLLPAENVDHEAPLPPAPVPGPTVEYGRHMALTGGCTGCHGATFSGGQIPGTPPDWPPARNITFDKATGIGAWSEADFFKALREGKRPNGDTISSVMPWRYTALLKDDDIRALYLYLKSQPPKAMGNR